MRRSLLAVLLVATACIGSDQELAPTPPTAGTEPTTSSVPSSTTSTTGATTSTAQATTTTSLPPLQSLAYEEVAVIDFPIQMVGWVSGLSLVATKDGRVWVMEPDGDIRGTPLLDMRDQVTNDGERGLLSIVVAEDPNRVFVHYSGSAGETVVSEFAVEEGALIDERVIFEHEQPAGNHNGGMLQFGPDGYLYLGLGDGGGANDTYGNGQDTGTLLGGLVRIDVNDPDADPVLWNYGLRNPWRFWIELETGLIYIADVGQNSYEEVNVTGLEEGVNYGWPVTEALHCFSPSSNCDTEGLTLPVIEVEHGDAGTCSITGGIVYRGEAVPEIDGHYFYSDYCGGYLRSFRVSDAGLAEEETDWTDQLGLAGRVSSFGVDFSGEMYVLTTDRILKIVAER